MKTSTPPRHFEVFLPSGTGADIFAKIEAFDTFVEAYGGEYVAGLGVQMLGATGHAVTIREVDGTEHPVIMLGSNSYRGLTIHP